MSAFSPAMQTALAGQKPLIFGALKIELPSANLCLLDGAGVATFGGDIYVGRDENFGSLAAIDSLSDGTGDDAPSLNITLLPADTAAAVTLCDPAMQGSPVSLYMGAIDRSTGDVIADPMLIFFGELDQPMLSVDRGTRELEFECVSAFERLFDNDEGARMADSFHQSIWPGELGMSNVTGIVKTIYWGVEGPRSSISFGGAIGSFVGRFLGGGTVKNV